MKYLILAILLGGCFQQPNVTIHTRIIVDNGDDTRDNYTKLTEEEASTESNEMNLKSSGLLN